MCRPQRAVCTLLTFACANIAFAFAAGAQQPSQPSTTAVHTPGTVPLENKAQPDGQNEQQELQKAIGTAANDRAALVKNLEGFLQKYPESSERTQIYRALVEANVQLRDFPRAMDYAERMVSLNPNDISNMVLTIELLERYGDTPGYRRAVFYCSRVIDYVERTSSTDKSPRVSPEDWAAAKKRDKSSLLVVRGRLYQKLNDTAHAEADFQASYATLPNAAAAEHLGEIAELRHDLTVAIQEYARAFNLTDGTNGASPRTDLRKKVGNVWRLAHGSEEGLGDYLLHAFDETNTAAAPGRQSKNSTAKDPYEFVLRQVNDGSLVPLAGVKGKVLVLNFWATWCGPCRALEPHFDRVAANYAGRHDVAFYALNCDDDESLVGPYLQAEKPRASVLFADGLDHLLGVVSFPTTLILDRTGKIAFRVDGFDADGFEKSLTNAVERVVQPSVAPSPAAAVRP